MFEFDGWRCDPESLTLEKGEQTHRVEPKAMAVLQFLAHHANEVVPTQGLLDEIWPDVVVTDNAVHRVITQLRKALGDSSKNPSYIQSIPRKGYRFLAEITTAPATQGSLGRLGVAIKIASDIALVDEQLFIRTSNRYLDWRSAAIRVLRGPTVEKDADYLIDVYITEIPGVVTLNWEIIDQHQNELVGAHSHTEGTEDYGEKQLSIAELVAEAAASDILRHRLGALRRQGSEEAMTYWDRLIIADRYRSMASDELNSRQQLIQQAQALEPNLPYAHAAYAEFRSWEVANGLAEQPLESIREVNQASDRAMELDPNDLYSLMRCGTALSRVGRYDDGVSLCKKAVELFPSVTSKDFYAMALTFAGLPEAAIEVYFDLLSSLPRGRVYQYGRVVVPLVQHGEFETAAH